MRYQNSSYFLEVGGDSIHLKIVNNTFYLVGDPFLIHPLLLHLLGRIHCMSRWVIDLC